MYPLQAIINVLFSNFLKTRYSVILTKKGRIAARETRNALAARGKEMGLEVELWDIVAVELTQVPTEQFMLWKVVRKHYVVDGRSIIS